MSYRPGLRLTALAALTLWSAWACMPDLDVLSSEYTGAGAGGTGATGATGGTSATGGTTSGNGGTDPTGGTSATGGSTGAVGGDTGLGGDSGMGNDAGAAGMVEPPPPEQCENLKKDGTETDVDCGGNECSKCDTKARCSKNTDCKSDFCNPSSKRCAEATCGDGFQNQDETGVDCGGSCVPGGTCDLDVDCEVNGDCTSQYCKAGICADHCTSGKKEADETDKDCGGDDCGPCDTDQGCENRKDCLSLNCANNKCVAPTCVDSILNQNESDTDCGGVCSAEGKGCPVAADCNYPEDCATVVCDSMHHCAADPIVVPASAVIDDFEDGDYFPNTANGFIGNWYPYGDGSGFVTRDVVSIPGGRGTSTKSLESTGKDFTSWGSGVGVDLNNPTGMQSGKLPWDASAYTGITFWAHAGAKLTVTVALPDIDTEPAGGRCDQPNNGCDHHFVKQIQIDDHWRRYVVRFSELVAEPGSVPEPAGFAPDAIMGIQFRMGGGQTYDLWIDDLAFVAE